MRRRRLLIHPLSLVVFILVILIGLCSYPACGAETNSSWMNLAEYTLNMTDSLEAKEYLGVESLKFFSISQIHAKLIVIGCFSLYCPICHRQAPKANKLFYIIQQDPDLSKDIKMIGICAGNNSKETGVYKTKFRVQFPLFSDPDFVIHKKFGSPRTPFTILVTNNGKVLLFHYGVMKDVEEFVHLVKKFHQQL